MKHRKPSRHQKHILWMLNKGCILSAPLTYNCLGLGMYTLYGCTPHSHSRVSISTICAMEEAGWIATIRTDQNDSRAILTIPGQALAETIMG
jgi:hypothetical protein